MTLRDAMDRLFEGSFVRPSRYFGGGEMEEGLLPLDVVQTDNDVIVKASLAGFKPEEVDISLQGDTLTIRGEHEEENEQKEGEYLLKERRYGNFARTVTLPVEVQSDKADANFENGVLTLTLPKAEETKPRQIKVKSRGGELAQGEKKTTAGKETGRETGRMTGGRETTGEGGREMGRETGRETGRTTTGETGRGETGRGSMGETGRGSTGESSREGTSGRESTRR
jgi:HSP20 family protein